MPQYQRDLSALGLLYVAVERRNARAAECRRDDYAERRVR